MTPTGLDPSRVTPRMVRAGRRIHEEGRVHYVPNGRVYTVQGDTLDAMNERVLYMVAVADGRMTCSCPAHGPCKHLQAVREARKPGAEPAHAIHPKES